MPDVFYTIRKELLKHGYNNDANSPIIIAALKLSHERFPINLPCVCMTFSIEGAVEDNKISKIEFMWNRSGVNLVISVVRSAVGRGFVYMADLTTHDIKWYGDVTDDISPIFDAFSRICDNGLNDSEVLDGVVRRLKELRTYNAGFERGGSLFNGGDGLWVSGVDVYKLIEWIGNSRGGGE